MLNKGKRRHRMTYWAYHLPNMLLAAAMYTLLGRCILSLFFPPDSDKVIWRAFVRITDPIVRIVRQITPALVPGRLVVLFSAVWVLLARIALLFGFAIAGALPKAGG